VTFFRYGGHQHPVNECNLVRVDQRNSLSPRGRRLQNTLTFYLMGELQYTGAELIAKCSDLINAYRNDYGNAALYYDNGTATTHQMDNGTSVSGVRVLHRSWAKGDAAELANKRTFSIVLQASYDDCEDQIVSWTERLRYIGNTGPRFEVIDTFNGPQFLQTAAVTAQRIIQTGVAVGYSAHPLPPGPVFPGFEHQDQRQVELISGRMQGQGARFFPTTWQYVHTLPTYSETIPLTI
jgi:hypothetical protein